MNWTSFRSAFNVGWKKNQNKHSKFDTKFVIQTPCRNDMIRTLNEKTNKNWYKIHANSVVLRKSLWWAAKLMTFEKNEKTKNHSYLISPPIQVAFVGFETPWLKKTYLHNFWTQELVGIIVGFNLFIGFFSFFRKERILF